MADDYISTYAETAALYAVLNGDTHNATRIVTGMHPTERQTYREQLWHLLGIIDELSAAATPDGAPKTEEPAYPDVHVRLSGQEGNAHYVIGLVAQALRKSGHRTAADTFTHDAFRSDSYDELLQLTLRTVTVS